MGVVDLASLLVRETKAAIYERGIGIARMIGLPVSSWQPGDPSRSLLFLEAEFLESWEVPVVGFIASGFLDYATGTWLKILAKQVFNVDVPDATYAETDVTLTNDGAGVYDDIAPGDLTVKSSLSGKTYRNTTGGDLGPKIGALPGTLTLHFVADEAGSASSAGAGEIDEMVTTLIKVTCANATAAIGLDEQDEATTRQQCRDKLDSLSPNGAKGAYTYVARNAKLTGTNAVTRARDQNTSDTGDVTIYVAGPSGVVAGPDVALVQTAIATWATPLCVTPTVLSAAAIPVAVTYTVWVYKSVNKTAPEIQADILAALESIFAREEIGGDIIPPAATGALYKSKIETAIQAVYRDENGNGPIFRVTVAAPGGDTALTNAQVAVLGAVTPTINLVPDP